ncbi:MAG TPA: TonB family protein [Thermoanaerobaculia bacterium]|nr:TonB family protein [Thermoanaerobaculia bacterium]
MEIKTPCTKCSRQIDTVARICPFCNQDQSAPVEFAVEQTAGASVPAPGILKSETARFWTAKVLLAIGVVALLVGVFAVGAFVNKLGTKAENKEIVTTTDAPDAAPTATPNQFADVQLVPVSDAADAPNIVEMPVTSSAATTSVAQIPEELQREDVTALPSEQYSRVLEMSKPKPPKVAPLPSNPPPRVPPLLGRASQPVAPPPGRATQPLTLPPGRASQPSPRANPGFPSPRDVPGDAPSLPGDGDAGRQAGRAEMTQPVPIYQPLPNIKNRSREIKADGTMRFRLTIGRDGNVKEVQVLQSMEGLTDKMIGAIQKWKFKPATSGGAAVEGEFPVDISFKAGDQ